MEPIRLTISEPAGIARRNWPVTRGVPLPQGEVAQVDDLRLTSAIGEIAASQFRVLSHWPDGTIKWVLVDTQIDIDGGATQHLHLTSTAETTAPVQDEWIDVDESAEAVTVCTGVMRFTVRRDRAGICEDVQLGHRAGGVFEPTADLCRAGADVWARIREGESFGGTRRRIYGVGGLCRATLAPDAWSVEVEEAGPLRVVLACRGALEAESPMHHYAGYRPLHFILRIHAYAGQRSLRCLHTTVMTLNPREVQIEELGLRWPLPGITSEGDESCRVGSAGEIDLSPGESMEWVQRAAEDGGQIRHSTSTGRHIEEGEIQPWVVAERRRGGMGVALRYMMEEGPKALRVRSGDSIDVLPYAGDGEAVLDLSRYAEDVAWHEGEGIYSDGTGTAKTTELCVTWFEPGQALAASQSLAASLAPLTIGVDAAHMSACQVTGGFAPASERHPAAEKMLAGVVDWLWRQIHEGKWFGFLDWGDVLIAFEESAQTWRYHGRWGWCNSEWDPRHGVWIQYLRTGEPRWFDLAEAMTRHSVDVDTCHWHPFRPYFVGGCYRHSVSHFSDEPSASHTFIDNWVDYYYLTGDLRTLEVIREAGAFFKRYRWTDDPQFSFSLRSIANVLRGLLYVYDVTADASCLNRALEVYEVLCRGQNEDGSWNKRFQVSTPDRVPSQLPFGMATEGTTLAVEQGTPPFTDEEHLALAGGRGPIRHEVPSDQLKGYQTHYLLIGIELLHRLTGRADVEAVYLRAVDWFCTLDDDGDPSLACREHYGGILCRHLAHAWRLTGNESYLETGRRVLQEVMNMQDWSDDPLRHGAIGMSPMYLSLVFFGVPFFLQALDEAGADSGG